MTDAELDDYRKSDLSPRASNCGAGAEDITAPSEPKNATVR
jgi:hypothetical protein